VTLYVPCSAGLVFTDLTAAPELLLSRLIAVGEATGDSYIAAATLTTAGASYAWLSATIDGIPETSGPTAILSDGIYLSGGWIGSWTMDSFFMSQVINLDGFGGNILYNFNNTLGLNTHTFEVFLMGYFS